MDLTQLISKFKTIEDWDDILILSHYDADGLCSCAQLVKILRYLGKSYRIHILEQLTRNHLNALDGDENIIFLDFGSNYPKEIENKFKNYLIVDHHQTEYYPKNMINIRQIGYCENEGCTSSIMYYISKMYGLEDAKISLIGVLGDVQKDRFLFGINKEITNNLPQDIKEVYDLDFFGYKLRNMVDFLAYSKEELIDIYKNRDYVRSILFKLNIDENENYISLDDTHKNKLKKYLYKKYCSVFGPEKCEEILFSNMYIDNYENITLEEISTMINSCGRLNLWTNALKYLLGETGLNSIELIYKKQREILKKYLSKIELEEYGSFKVFEIDNPNIVGILCGMMLNGSSNKIIVGLGINDNYIKISMRSKEKRINVGKILSAVCNELGGEGGGHERAGGGYIDVDKKEEFLKLLKEKLEIFNR